MFRYFFSYQMSTGGGMCEYVSDRPITTMDQVTNVAQAIADSNGWPRPVSVISFQLLSGPETDGFGPA
jgi:hypothetical protein